MDGVLVDFFLKRQVMIILHKHIRSNTIARASQVLSFTNQHYLHAWTALEGTDC